MKHDRGEYGGLPAPDAKDPDHGNFVRDWFGQISDEELGNEPVDEFYGLSVGEVVRDRVMTAIGEIEMRHARRAAAIERAAIVAYEEHGESDARALTESGLGGMFVRLRTLNTKHGEA